MLTASPRRAVGMNIESAFIILFIIAMAVAIIGQRLRLPYTVGLVLAGLILGAVHLFPAPELNKELLFSIFLPGLIFEAAFHLDFHDLWRNRLTLGSLAVPGVVASTALIAVAFAPIASLHNFLPGFTWKHALVFGALIAATDPVAVLALFGRLGAPHRLSLLIEGESLLNDGTGIVFFTLSLSIFAGGSDVTAWRLTLEFLMVVGIGAAIGIAVGLVVATIMRTVDDPMIEVSLTTIAAYGSFVLAEHLGYSGVIATLAAGIVCGSYAARTSMSPSTRVAAETFWEYVAFALNSIVFLLIGIEVPIGELAASWLPILVAYLIVTISRGVLVFIVSRVVWLTRERFPRAWGIALTWGGLRGALPMVLALGLPLDFPLRQHIVSITFGVVILSILGHGLTMAPLLRMLGIVHRDERAGYDLLRGELQSAAAALAEIDQLERLRSLPPGSLEPLRQDYQKRIDQVREAIGKLTIAEEQLHAQDLYQARLHLLMVEKNRVAETYRRGLLSQTVHERLLADIDARILELESNGEASAPGPEEKHA
jgi:Na+:H+ antiporter